MQTETAIREALEAVVNDAVVILQGKAIKEYAISVETLRKVEATLSQLSGEREFDVPSVASDEAPRESSMAGAASRYVAPPKGDK
ncbi:hypothetical protein [Microvirga sp. Mcv34]|uniref:hypothetical protein n=1 Tax=Microvirga sp. Mcv34 TaxID=2926016 RepID=UPI0021C708AF|nr:hypothetical protein [Microvirga sp. Mcv34]